MSSSALFDAAVRSNKDARVLTPQTQESKAAGQWKSLFASGQRKRKASSSKPAAENAQPKSKQPEQLYLDFGQRSFGKQLQCKTCGLTYTQGHPEDEEMHRRHHRRSVQGLSMHPSATERVVRALPEGGRIVLVLPSDPAERLRKLKEVTALMAAELGGEPALPRDGRAFLLVAGSAQRYRLLGCALAEPLQSAFRAAPQAAGSSSGVLRHDGVPQPALCGISHVWVVGAHRRQGVARQLLDAVRSNMLSGFELPIERLAFSQPTAQGRALAESYTGTQRFLVYAERPAEPAPAAAAAPRPGGPAPPAAAAASTEQGPHDSSARPPFLPPDYDVH